MMNAYLDVFEALKSHDHIKYTFSGQRNTFLFYAFFEDDVISPLDVSEELNNLAKQNGLCKFWLKNNTAPDKEKYNFAKDDFKYVYCYRVVGLESKHVDCV